MDMFRQNLRLAIRRLLASPGFTLIAILTLALGIGANTAVFSVVNSVLLRPLVYRAPQQLYLIREVVLQMTDTYPSLPANIQSFRRWQGELHSFDQIAIVEHDAKVLSGAGNPVELSGAMASANLFDTLGVEPQFGRTFSPDEDAPGRDREIILTFDSWRSRFHADQQIIGKLVTLDGQPYTIIGVLPAAFRFPVKDQLGPLTQIGERAEFFKPLGLDAKKFNPLGEFDFAAIGRLNSGISPEQALAELNVVQAEIVRDAKQGVDLKALLWPLQNEIVGAARPGLLLLLAGVGAVLLIVCINLANLLLIRVPARMREGAIRAVLGASPSQLLQQTLAESLLLAAAGGAFSIALAYAGLRAVVAAAPPNLPRLGEVHLDARVFLFALGISVLTGVIFGALPAWRLAHAQPLDAVKSGDPRAGESLRTRRVRESLIGFEVCVSALLLIVAGLLTTSFVRLLGVNTGFTAEHVLAADVSLTPRATAQQRQQFYDRVVAQLSAAPGVRAAGWVSKLPLTGEVSVSDITYPGMVVKGVAPLANYRLASADYFRAFGIALRAGRIFTEADRGQKVVVLSQSTADLLWPGQNPIGRVCRTDWGGDTQQEVIGIVDDIRTVQLDKNPPMMVYMPEWTPMVELLNSASFVVRAASSPESVESNVRRVIYDADPTVPITALRPMTEVIADSVDTRRFQMSLVLFFAICALLLAALGVFAVVAYSVEQRRRELGIRMALGAHASDLWTMVIRQGMRPVIVGLALGVVAALSLARLANGFLFGITPRDPLTFGAVILVVFAAGVLACIVPAIRATKLDPIHALRYE